MSIYKWYKFSMRVTAFVKGKAPVNDQSLKPEQMKSEQL
jgi:hypothetical protein